MTDIEAWLQTHAPTKCPPAYAAPSSATLPKTAVEFHIRRFAEQERALKAESPLQRRQRLSRAHIAERKRGKPA